MKERHFCAWKVVAEFPGTPANPVNGYRLGEGVSSRSLKVVWNVARGWKRLGYPVIVDQHQLEAIS